MGVETIELNANERTVLVTLARDAEGNGRDFGILEYAKNLGPIKGTRFGGFVTDLQRKGLIRVYDTITVNENDKVTQYTLEDYAWGLIDGGLA